MDTPTHFLPTDRERASLDRVWAWRRYILIVPLSALLLVVTTRMVPDQSPTLQITLVAILFASLVGPVLYVSFCLRCPRCAGWIGLGSPKCLSCGLHTAPPDDSMRKSAKAQTRGKPEEQDP
jgi:hypothetical protein